jgi:hypothetical protein
MPSLLKFTVLQMEFGLLANLFDLIDSPIYVTGRARSRVTCFRPSYYSLPPSLEKHSLYTVIILTKEKSRMLGLPLTGMKSLKNQ